MVQHILALVAGVMAATAGAAAEWSFPSLGGERPIIIAHRGASGYLPEHTLPAYELAVAQGADFIEPDLVMTKDGHLIARHDRHLSRTTDVADHPEFADRRRVEEGRRDWFVEDFTLAELKRLRARQPFPGRSTAFDGRFEIPTFAEILALLRDLERRTGRRIGIYPETKHPAHFAELGLEMSAPLLAALEKAGYGESEDRVFIQSFEPEILRRIDAASPLRLILLLAPREPEGTARARPDFPDGLTLETIAGFADGIGPSKTLVVAPDGADTGLVRAAHAAGLAVHVWTLRDDRLPKGYATVAQEYRALFAAGIDGLFADFPDTALTQRWLARLRAGLPEKNGADAAGDHRNEQGFP